MTAEENRLDMAESMGIITTRIVEQVLGSRINRDPSRRWSVLSVEDDVKKSLSEDFPPKEIDRLMRTILIPLTEN